jgi:hypothetical protein
MLLHGCALGKRSSGSISNCRISFFRWYIDRSYTLYRSGNMSVGNRVLSFWVILYNQLTRVLCLATAYFVSKVMWTRKLLRECVHCFCTNWYCWHCCSLFHVSLRFIGPPITFHLHLFIPHRPFRPILSCHIVVLFLLILFVAFFFSR